MKPFRLNRRAFLGGAGAMVSLPLLEAMVPSKALAQGNSPTRMLCYYVPNGMHMQSWTPATTGSDYALSKTLMPLSNVKDDVLVLSNLANRPGQPDQIGDHASGTGSFITATHVKKTEGSDIQNNISVDQVAANEIGQQTRFASLELGIEGGGSAGGCDSGYSCAYTRNISWSGPSTPKPKTVDPQVHFDRLFGGLDANATEQERLKRQKMNESVLSYVMDDTRKLQSKLGQNDREKLEEYLTSIEELETGLQRAAMDSADQCLLPDRPASNLSREAHVLMMTDLMVLAFECDLTRVQTFMLGNAGSYYTYGFLGINEGHHTISHHQSLQSNYDKLEIINEWEMRMFAYLLEQLKLKTDYTGNSILDSSLVFLSSEISDGNRHNHDNMPVVLAGQANGYLNTGRHVRYAQEQSFGDLFVSMLDAVDVQVSNFGDDGTSVLSDLS